MKEIYRTFADTEVSVLATHIKCPYCGYEWQEDDMDECGKTYLIECGDELLGIGCGRKFKMHFDAS